MALQSSSLDTRLAASPAHRALAESRAVLERIRVAIGPTHEPTRAMCISPYKTGTTFLAGLFAQSSQVAHEPMHLCTIRNLDSRDFLVRRHAVLSLDLESSGMFAHCLPLLRQSAPTTPFLQLYRPFISWVESVVNYMEELSKRVTFNYVARLVFDPITHPVRIDAFWDAPVQAQRSALTRLVDYWSSCYEFGLDDDRTMVLRLDSLESEIDAVATHLGLTPSIDHAAWRRSSAQPKDGILEALWRESHDDDLARVDAMELQFQ